jgi:CDP-diacylglycerol--glycerol-3-phosphate 3-phosphatidyltransferase
MARHEGTLPPLGSASARPHYGEGVTSLVPNALTALRLLGVPALVWLMLADDTAGGSLQWWALLVFLMASATDFLDGFLARRWRAVSVFGKFADPIADKALILAALAALSVVDGVPWWPFIVLAIREVAVTLGRFSVMDRGVIAASGGGKVKTTVQIAAVTFYLWPHGPAWLHSVAWWCLLLAVAIAVVTGVQYGRDIIRLRRAAPAPRPVDAR